MSHCTVLFSAALILSQALALGCYADSSAPAAPQTVAAAQPDAAAAPAPAPAASDEAVAWLDNLEARGREIRSLQSNLIYRKTNTLLDDTQVRTGELTYAAATPEQPARFAIDFKSLIINDTVQTDSSSWIFDGQWLVEKQPERKLFIKRQVVAPGAGERIDPLAVDGPFPLPLGQKREQVLQQFNVEVVPAADKPNLVHLKLTPRDGEGERRQFEQVDMWIDRESLLPVEVVTLDGSANQTRVQLAKVRVNEIAADALAGRFDTTSPAPGSGWRVETSRFEER